MKHFKILTASLLILSACSSKEKEQPTYTLDQAKVMIEFKEQEAYREKINKGRSIRNNWYKYITIDKDYKAYNIGGVTDASFTITNNSDYKLNSVTVAITYTKANGNAYKTIQETVKNINPRSQSTVKLEDTNRGVSMDVSIDEIISKDLNFHYLPGNWANSGEDPYFQK